MKKILNWIKRKFSIASPSDCWRKEGEYHTTMLARIFSKIAAMLNGEEEELQLKEEARDSIMTFQEACREANETLPTAEEFNEQMRAYFGIKQPGKVMKEFWEKGDTE